MESHQRRRIAYVERPQHHQVEETEGRDVDADADGQHRHRRQREPRRLAQHAHGVAQVLPQPVNPRPAPGIPRVLAQLEIVAEVVAARARRHLAVELHVVGQLAFELPAVEQIIQPAKKFWHTTKPLGSAQYGPDRVVDPLVGPQFGLERFLAAGRQVIKPDLAVGL